MLLFLLCVVVVHSPLKINQAESVEEQKPDQTRHVFTGLRSADWSGAPRMWSLKSMKTPGMPESSDEEGDGRAATERALGVLLHTCSVLLSSVKSKTITPLTVKTQDSFVLRNEP